MKLTRILILFLCVFNALICMSQSPFLVIDTTNNNINTLNPEGFVSWDSSSYKFDIEQNSINDFSFSSCGYMGGQLQESSLNVSTGDNSFIELQQVTYYYDSLDWTNSVVISDSGLTWVPKLYQNNDTIFPFTGSAGATISKSVWCSVPENHNPYILTALNGKSGYFAIKKTIDNIDYYGWLKISGIYSRGINVHQIAFEGDIIEFPLLEEPLIYPNPSKEFFNIIGESIELISVFDQSGKLILMQEYTSIPAIELEVNNWSPGIYIIKCTHNLGWSNSSKVEGITTKKFVKN
jgi:hypothetical protein